MSVEFLKSVRQEVTNLDSKDEISNSMRTLSELKGLVTKRLPEIEAKCNIDKSTFGSLPLADTVVKKVNNYNNFGLYPTYFCIAP